MGTDYLHLLDRRRAEIIIHATESELAALVDATTGITRPHVWQEYWDSNKEASVKFLPHTSATDRLRVMIAEGKAIEAIKDELLRELCIGGWLYLDYWGCYAEVFECVDPPGAITWEAFTEPMRAPEKSREPGGAQGTYLLTNDNVDSIIRSLDKHRSEVEIMNDEDIARLKSWRDFCRKFSGFCVLYQIDF